MQSSHKTILFSFILGVGIYVLSANKNNGSLAICFGPLAIICANFIEKIEKNWVKEIVIYALLGLGIFFFIMQL
jgi:energy-coupling factor transporter transmembrane protein EcfT